MSRAVHRDVVDQREVHGRVAQERVAGERRVAGQRDGRDVHDVDTERRQRRGQVRQGLAYPAALQHEAHDRREDEQHRGPASAEPDAVRDREQHHRRGKPERQHEPARSARARRGAPPAARRPSAVVTASAGNTIQARSCSIQGAPAGSDGGRDPISGAGGGAEPVVRRCRRASRPRGPERGRSRRPGRAAAPGRPAAPPRAGRRRGPSPAPRRTRARAAPSPPRARGRRSARSIARRRSRPGRGSACSTTSPDAPERRARRCRPPSSTTGRPAGHHLLRDERVGGEREHDARPWPRGRAPPARGGRHHAEVLAVERQLRLVCASRTARRAPRAGARFSSASAGQRQVDGAALGLPARVDGDHGRLARPCSRERVGVEVGAALEPLATRGRSARRGCRPSTACRRCSGSPSGRSPRPRSYSRRGRVERGLVVLDEVDLLAAAGQVAQRDRRSTTRSRCRRRRRVQSSRPVNTGASIGMKCSRISSRSSPPRRALVARTGRRRRSRSRWPRRSICRTSRKIVVWPPEPMLHGGTTQASVRRCLSPSGAGGGSSASGRRGKPARTKSYTSRRTGRRPLRAGQGAAEQRARRQLERLERSRAPRATAAGARPAAAGRRGCRGSRRPCAGCGGGARPCERPAQARRRACPARAGSARSRRVRWTHGARACARAPNGSTWPSTSRRPRNSSK